MATPDPSDPRPADPDDGDRRDDLDEGDGAAVDQGEQATRAETPARAWRIRGPRAEAALVQPWSERRARRWRRIVIALMVLGPVLGTVLALRLVPADPTDVLTEDTSAADEDVQLIVNGTIRAIDAPSGEMAVRLVLASTPESGLVTDGLLDEDLRITVNDDAGGLGVRELPAGEPLGAISLSTTLDGSRATRYPVDRYDTRLVVAATTADGTRVPLRLSLRSSDPQFVVEVRETASVDGVAYAEMRVGRRGTVIGWAGFFVLVCWLIAVSAATIGWTTVVHGLPSPVWAWGFLVGVLFALPQLRNALPGEPQGGSLVDFAAFYWAVGIVVLTLVVMIGSWNLRVRRAPDNPDAPRP